MTNADRIQVQGLWGVVEMSAERRLQMIAVKRTAGHRNARGFGRLIISVAALAPAALASSPPGRPALVVTQIPLSDHGPDSGPLPANSRLVLIDASGHPKPLVEDFAASGYADVSFDGRRLLFVGRKTAAARAGVWELSLDDSGLRRVVDFPGECHRAIYLPAIYTIDAEKPVYQIAVLGTPPDSSTPALFTCELNGSHLRQISFSPSGVAGPLLLDDGRLVISMGVGLDDRTNASFFTINTDGTDLFPFAALHGPNARRAMPCGLSGDRVVFVESPFSREDAGGSLLAVARTRSLEPPVTLMPGDAGRYHSPAPGPEDSLLVSYRADATVSYGVVLLDPLTGRRQDTVFDDPSWHDVGAKMIRPRTMPPGRSSVVNDRLDTGQLYCLDAYLTDLERSEPGTIKHVRVLQGATDLATETTLGEVPVDVDGSFFLELPARTPFRLETLDADRAIVRAMRTWMWVMPNERRGCIGCHEDRLLTPPNRHVLALRRRPHKLQAPPRPNSIPASAEGASP